MRRRLTTLLPSAVLVCAIAVGLYAVAGPRPCSSTERELLRSLAAAGGVELKGRRPALLSLNLFGETCDVRFDPDDPARTLKAFTDELERRGWRLEEQSASHVEARRERGGWISIGHYYPEEIDLGDAVGPDGEIDLAALDADPVRPEGFSITLSAP
jgi:hypothetical protein